MWNAMALNQAWRAVHTTIGDRMTAVTLKMLESAVSLVLINAGSARMEFTGQSQVSGGGVPRSVGQSLFLQLVCGILAMLGRPL
jgi:hypothetical protein